MVLGTTRALGCAMGARRYEDLEAWQLCRQLADEIAVLLETRKASDDFDLFNQLKSASRASCRNIAEGFGRYYPKEFAPFLRIAKGSLLEIGEHLRDATAARWITTEREADLIRLRDRAMAASVRLLAYLESDPPQGPTRPTRKPRG